MHACMHVRDRCGERRLREFRSSFTSSRFSVVSVSCTYCLSLLHLRLDFESGKAEYKGGKYILEIVLLVGKTYLFQLESFSKAYSDQVNVPASS